MVKILGINVILFIFFILAVFLSGIIQSTGLLSVKNLNPNASLVILLLAAIFSSNFLELLFYLFFSFFILNWQPSLSGELCSLAAVVIFAYFANSFLSLSKTVNFVILVAFSTVFFYLFSFSSFLFDFPLIALKEIFINSLLAAVISFFVSFFSNRFHFI